MLNDHFKHMRRILPEYLEDVIGPRFHVKDPVFPGHSFKGKYILARKMASDKVGYIHEGLGLLDEPFDNQQLIIIQKLSDDITARRAKTLKLKDPEKARTQILLYGDDILKEALKAMAFDADRKENLLYHLDKLQLLYTYTDIMKNLDQTLFLAYFSTAYATADTLTLTQLTAVQEALTDAISSRRYSLDPDKHPILVNKASPAQ